MTNVRKVEVTEVGPRDGLQAEKRLIPAAEKIALINRLIDAGVPRIEATSFVSPKAVPQLADAAEVMAGIDRSKGAIIAALVPNARGAIRAAECNVDEMVVFVSASESHNRKNVNRSVEESLKGFEEVAKIAADAKIPVHGALATAFG
jgi:hydroxymethylglutaryl-CoA lyase